MTADGQNETRARRGNSKAIRYAVFAAYIAVALFFVLLTVNAIIYNCSPDYERAYDSALGMGRVAAAFVSPVALCLGIVFIVVLAVATAVAKYIADITKRRATERAALKKSMEALSSVGLRYENINEITAVIDVLGMITSPHTTKAERQKIDERLKMFISAATLSIPHTPETAAIFDSLPAPDTPMSLSAALSAGATLRQAEDGQTLILTTASGDKHIVLTPITTPEGIILCQQGVRVRADIAPNIEDVGMTSIPTAPEFFEGQPLEKYIEYPELPQPERSLSPAQLLQTAEFEPDRFKTVPVLPAGEKPRELPTSQTIRHIPPAPDMPQQQATSTQQQPAAQQPAAQQPATTQQQQQSATTQQQQPATTQQQQQPPKSKRDAYKQYREQAAIEQLRETERLHELIDRSSPLSQSEQERVDSYRAKNKKSGRKQTPEQIAKRKAAAARRKAEREAFLATLSDEDRELYLAEERIQKQRNAALRKLKRIAADRKTLEELDGKSTD